jgi:hypothetical protein
MSIAPRAACLGAAAWLAAAEARALTAALRRRR